jgi:hypothetical protein
VQHHLATQRPWLTIERLPAYAPELHPVEALWGQRQGPRVCERCAPSRPALVRPSIADGGACGRGPISRSASWRTRDSPRDHYSIRQG